MAMILPLGLIKTIISTGTYTRRLAEAVLVVIPKRSSNACFITKLGEDGVAISRTKKTACMRAYPDVLQLHIYIKRYTFVSGGKKHHGHPL